jgi:hypothetical protein
MMTSGGRHVALLEALPNDVAALCWIVQGLAIHEYMARAYGVTVPDERKGESHIRTVERLLDRLLDLDPQPLAVSRAPERRVVGVCHHFMLLLVAMLRAKGVAARGRYGFGSYFNPPYFEDHVVCEYWSAAAARWILVDPQLDAVWNKELKIDFDPLDVPRERFVVAGDAWMQCRTGKADPSKYGIFVGDLRGLWFIAGAVLRDVAALNRMEMLPWDVWGAMPRPNQELRDDELAFFARLAALTREPDEALEELRTLYDGDERVRVPASVFNAVLDRTEVLERAAI